MLGLLPIFAPDFDFEFPVLRDLWRFASRTEEKRTATLNALRDHLAKIPDEKVREKLAEDVVSYFADGIISDGFEVGSKWMINAKLSSQEMDSITKSMKSQIRDGDHQKWIEWSSSHLPLENAKNSVSQMMTGWTYKDYAAAGKWLSAAPDGPTKVAAVRSYAETVSQYEPEAATQWALTLPPGRDRDEALKSIYQNWPRKDTAAKEAFAKQHGIK